MAVFRVERNKGYTVMSNHHLRNKELTLKAKGLLSQMLSLPEDWDYTLAGLSQINREKIDAIREAIKELERAGYIVRSRERDEKGRLRGADYVIYEQPHTEPTPDLPTLDNPHWYLTSAQTATTSALTLPAITAGCIARNVSTCSHAASGSRPGLNTATTGILSVSEPTTLTGCGCVSDRIWSDNK